MLGLKLEFDYFKQAFATWCHQTEVASVEWAVHLNFVLGGKNTFTLYMVR